jgi:hypothetical protein
MMYLCGGVPAKCSKGPYGLEPSDMMGSPVEQPVDVFISRYEASLKALSRPTMSFYVIMNFVLLFWNARIATLLSYSC